jgi:hypothetical protein
LVSAHFSAQLSGNSGNQVKTAAHIVSWIY